jgi:hypothetical protein
MTISSASAATVSWSGSGTAPQTKTATWKCVVTDAVASSVTTSNVSVSLTFNTVTLTATIDKNNVSSSGTGVALLLTSDAVTVTPAGGTPGYTYLWQFMGGDSVSSAANTATASSTVITLSSTSPDTEIVFWRCKVTDSASNIAYTTNTTATFVWS